MHIRPFHSMLRATQVAAVLALVVALTLPHTPARAGSVDQEAFPVTAIPADTLRLRSGPGTQHSTIGLVPGGATLAVLGRNGAATWIEVEYGGRRGWIAAWYCTITGDLAAVPVTDGSATAPVPGGGGVIATTGDVLRLRSGPGTGYSRLRLIPAATVLAVLGRSADGAWLYVDYTGTRGWVAAAYCSLSGDLNSMPVVNRNGNPVTPGGGSVQAAVPISPPPIIPRSAWGARPDAGGMIPQTPQYITIHMDGEYFNGDPVARMQLLQSWAMDTRGWPDIPYHFVIDRQGNIYEGRPVQFAGDTGTNYNPVGHISITLMGDYDVQAPRRAQIDAVISLTAWLSVTYNIPPDRIAGHRDYAYTTCPGEYVYFDYVASGAIRQAVENRLQGR